MKIGACSAQGRAPLAPPPLNSYKAKKAKIITTKYIAISV